MSAIINALKTALAADPENWETRHGLVEACLKEDNLAEATEALNGVNLPEEEAPRALALTSYEAVAVAAHEAGETEVAASMTETFRSLGGSNEALNEAYPEEALEVALAADEEEEEYVEPAEDVMPEGAQMSGEEEFHEPDVAFAGEEVPEWDESLFEEIERIRAMEAESERRALAARKRDKLNALTATVLVHVAIGIVLWRVVEEVPRDVPPSIVATAAVAQPTEDIEVENIKKPTPRQPSATSTPMPDILSVSTSSNVSLSNVDIQVDSPPADFGMMFAPSMDISTPTSSESAMMFGQKIEGDVLGVILDVSGSMAEFLPRVVREVDKNFKNAPIVYVNNVQMTQGGRDTEIRPVVESEVKPHYSVEEDPQKSRTPYWFLWYDLPRKAEQRYVDRLIDTFKTRPNSFIAVNGNNRIGKAMDFLAEQKVDALYVFSDFEDFVEEEIATTYGQMLGRKNIKTYVQPVNQHTEFLQIMARRVAGRSQGRMLPSLQDIDRGEKKESLVLTDEETMAEKLGITYATPRSEVYGQGFYEPKLPNGYTEIGRYESDTFDAVFYGPEARGQIFMKNREGQYIAQPITFAYHCWKRIDDKEFVRHRRRKLIKMLEEPTFDGKELHWNMLLEDDIEFEVFLYLDRRGMNATYRIEVPEGVEDENDHIYFQFPRTAHERNDLYFGYDIPETGLELDTMREVVKVNTAVFDLPSQFRDRYERHWTQLGFEPGDNERNFAELIRQYPNGIREINVQGPSFGERVLTAKTTSNKVLLRAGAWRRDNEMWEGFHANIKRTENRHRFTKQEAISFSVE